MLLVGGGREGTGGLRGGGGGGGRQAGIDPNGKSERGGGRAGIEGHVGLFEIGESKDGLKHEEEDRKTD